jgi:hypothetical protein
MNQRTCVDPSGQFVYGLHKPAYRVENLRENNFIRPLGWFRNGEPCDNRVNFPPGRVEVPNADPVFEVPNPFPFKGVTYILKRWADQNAADPSGICLPKAPRGSFTETLRDWVDQKIVAASAISDLFCDLPDPVKLAIAETSTDPEDLITLAELSCHFIHDKKSGRPMGLKYQADETGRTRPVIFFPLLFEMVANNPSLPDDYKEVMVLRPGVQGDSEIVGEFPDMGSGQHIFEYLRQNSYIPGGHYAANCAHDAVRYRLSDLGRKDMRAMRHLYYQRTYVRLAGELGVFTECNRRTLSTEELENLRRDIVNALSIPEKQQRLSANRTLWGWNFGFDYAPSGYRLHASHQQIHQQYAMVPVDFETHGDGDSQLKPYACGDMVADFIEAYHRQTGTRFFDAYIQAIYNNKRMDGGQGEDSLIIFADEHILLFVPKAQTSQWEVQLMTRGPVGNIIEADQAVRESIDRGMLLAVQVLEAMGARMITTIEYAKAIDDPSDNHQRLIYAFLPRLPESPGAFSEAQLRWINGHYPEDFAAVCRARLSGLNL